MKKLITLLFLTSGLVGVSQNIALIHDGQNVVSDTIDQYVTINTVNITTDIGVANLSGTYLAMKVRRTIYTMDAMDSTQFCWGGQCYQPPTIVSFNSAFIAPGDTIDYTHPPASLDSVNYAFHVLFNTGPSTATRYVRYKFYNVHDATDFAEVTIRYIATVGINETSKANNVIFNAYPNPANSFVSIKYDMNEFSQKGRIVFYDVLGKSVKEIVLTDKKGVANINTSDMNTGIYFYKFIVDDKTISTKKLVISSR